MWDIVLEKPWGVHGSQEGPCFGETLGDTWVVEDKEDNLEDDDCEFVLDDGDSED
jgi:hypothetical protein